MIDAQAVLAQLETLRDQALQAEGAGDAGNTQQFAGLAWLEKSLQPLSAAPHRDAAGNVRITLPGKSERIVVLGSYLEVAAGSDRLDSRLGLVTGIEVLKALAHRYEGRPPCTVQLVVWAKPAAPQAIRSLPAASAVLSSAFERQNASAYLELHIEPGAQLENAGTPLGVVTAAFSAGDPVAFNPRLMALCDEAIRELTGTASSLPSGPATHAVEAARSGIPSAMMYVQALPQAAGEDLPSATRLHLLQAAEAFGRWVESTMHLVAGEEVDLWAREGRVPHADTSHPLS